MNLSKKNIKIILGIITFAIILFSMSQNLSVVGMFLQDVLKIVSPVIVGFCIAFILNIPMSFIEKKVFRFTNNSKKKFVRKLKRPLSLISTVIMAIGFVVLLLFIIIPQLETSVALIIEKVPAYYKSVILWVDSVIEKYSLDINTNILHNPSFDINTIGSWLKKIFTAEATNSILSTTVNVTSSVVSGVVNTVIGFVIAIYMLAEKERLLSYLNKLFCKLLPEKVYDKSCKICNVAFSSFSNFISGQFTDAFILAVLCFIGMSIFRFPNAAVISTVIGITALIPVIGPFIGEFIGCFILFMDRPLNALFFLIFVLILQAIDNNFIYPKIVGKSVGLPGIVVLIAVVVGGNIGGIMGVLLGVPVSSSIYAIVTEWINEKKEVESVSEENQTDTEEEQQTMV